MSVAIIESLDHEGRGVTHADGKVVFIEGALPGETVVYDVTKSRPNYAQASTREVVKGSAQRVVPRCEYFGHCGGCSMQHLDAAAQTAAKQRCDISAEYGPRSSIRQFTVPHGVTAIARG